MRKLVLAGGVQRFNVERCQADPRSAAPCLPAAPQYKTLGKNDLIVLRVQLPTCPLRAQLGREA
jgi:hypothetical protein